MQIGILSRSREIYSTKRLVEEAENRGHHVRVIDILRCYVNITSDDRHVYFKSRDHSQRLQFDAIIPRIGVTVTSYGTAVVRQFEVGGAYALNSSVAIARSRDKLRAHQLLSCRGLDTPITSYAHGVDATEDLIETVGGAPLIVKILQSTHGGGVVLAETNKAAESVINAFRELRADILVQEFIQEAKGADIRCLVVGDRVVASMKRQAAEGEFRSNLHIGGTSVVEALSHQERELAVKAAKVIGLSVAGVDIIRSKRGPLVLEVNSTPGLEGIEKTTGENVAALIITHLEDHAHLGSAKLNEDIADGF